jgi:molecular chaperone GrpE
LHDRAAEDSVHPHEESTMADRNMEQPLRREPAQPGAYEENIDMEPPNVSEAESPPESGNAGSAAPSERDAAAETAATEAEARQIEADLEATQREFATLSDRHLRLAAEFDNYRKRVDRERADAWSRAQGDLAARLLDSLDDLERVGHHADASSAEALLEGVRLVERKLRQALTSAGLETVDADGARFDPNTMEAVAMVETESHEEDDVVSDVFQRGYTFRGTLLRPARVRVKKHGA